MEGQKVAPTHICINSKNTKQMNFLILTPQLLHVAPTLVFLATLKVHFKLASPLFGLKFKSI